MMLQHPDRNWCPGNTVTVCCEDVSGMVQNNVPVTLLNSSWQRNIGRCFKMMLTSFRAETISRHYQQRRQRKNSTNNFVIIQAKYRSRWMCLIDENILRSPGQRWRAPGWPGKGQGARAWDTATLDFIWRYENHSNMITKFGGNVWQCTSAPTVFHVICRSVSSTLNEVKHTHLSFLRHSSQARQSSALLINHYNDQIQLSMHGTHVQFQCGKNPACHVNCSLL